MNIFDKEAEQPLMDFIEQLRSRPQEWRALHLHFSALQPENKKVQQIQTVTNIVQAHMGQFTGAAYVCRDGDLVIVFEHPGAKNIDAMVTDMRFLFADDPLASASYVSGQPDNFYTSYDLSFAFDQFFYMCLHKLSLVKQDGPESKSPSTPILLPSLSVFQKAAQNKLTRKQLKILVVEDSYFSRQMLRQALTPKHEVFLAKNGWEGVAMYLSHAPNITFLDIDMPQMNGHEVLTKITGYDPSPFVVMLTASNMSNDIKNAIGHGAKGYIVKPFSIAKLTAYIDQYIKETGIQLQQR